MAQQRRREQEKEREAKQRRQRKVEERQRQQAQRREQEKRRQQQAEQEAQQRRQKEAEERKRQQEQKARRSCSYCSTPGHNIRTCPVKMAAEEKKKPAARPISARGHDIRKYPDKMEAERKKREKACSTRGRSRHTSLVCEQHSSASSASSDVDDGLKLAELKVIAHSLGIDDPPGHKGHKKTWIDAINRASSGPVEAKKTDKQGQKHCSICKGTGHNKRTCPKSLQMALDSKKGFAGKDFTRQGRIKDTEINERAASVVWIDTGSGLGSGIYVKYDGYHCVLTNNHVLGSEAIAARATANFDFEKGRKLSQAIEFSPNKFFATSKDQDFTVVCIKDARRCNNRTPVRLFRTKANVGDDVTIIQHPGGGEKKVATGKICELGTNRMWYDCDTEPGSSGSAVFNKQWDLIGLHHAGNRSKNLNQGIPIIKVIDCITQQKKQNSGAHKHDSGSAHHRKPEPASVPYTARIDAPQNLSDELKLGELKEIARSMGITEPIGHKGHKQTWIDAISSNPNSDRFVQTKDLQCFVAGQELMPKRASPGPPVATTDGWSCSYCTFVNNLAIPKCEICDSPKPAPRSKTNKISDQTVTPSNGSWVCSVCTLINACDDRFCDVCGNPSPAPQPSSHAKDAVRKQLF